MSTFKSPTQWSSGKRQQLLPLYKRSLKEAIKKENVYSLVTPQSGLMIFCGKMKEISKKNILKKEGKRAKYFTSAYDLARVGPPP